MPWWVYAPDKRLQLWNTILASTTQLHPWCVTSPLKEQNPLDILFSLLFLPFTVCYCLFFCHQPSLHSEDGLSRLYSLQSSPHLKYEGFTRTHLDTQTHTKFSNKWILNTPVPKMSYCFVVLFSFTCSSLTKKSLLMFSTRRPSIKGCGDITYPNELLLIALNYPCVWYISEASVHTDCSAFCFADHPWGTEEQSLVRFYCTRLFGNKHPTHRIVFYFLTSCNGILFTAQVNCIQATTFVKFVRQYRGRWTCALTLRASSDSKQGHFSMLRPVASSQIGVTTRSDLNCKHITNKNICWMSYIQ